MRVALPDLDQQARQRPPVPVDDAAQHVRDAAQGLRIGPGDADEVASVSRGSSSG